MKKREKVLLSFLMIGVLGALVGGFSVYGAFSATTTNPGNDFSTGTVTIADNDSNQALYNVSGQKPGDTTTKCIKVTYTGSLAADVRLYTTSSIATVGQYVDLTITPGTQASSTFPDCTNFTPDSGGAIFTGTLQSFASTHGSYATGLADFPGSTSAWNQNDAVVYRFQVTLQSGAPDTAQGQATGTHAYTWEARNQ